MKKARCRSRKFDDVYRHHQSLTDDRVNSDHPDLKLSEHQMQFFVDFRRAKDALPPPYLFKEHPYLFPMMKSSRPVDLVQDAASDCSVVASLCALTARAERGHGKVTLAYSHIYIT